MNVALTITALAAAGLAVLILVSRELSQRSGIPLAGRIALAGLLGFGVLALTIKAAVLASLQSPAALAGAVEAGRALHPEPPRSQGGAAPRGLTYPARGRSWRPLPVVEIPDAGSPRVALGRALFFDTRLSADGKVSCASCHAIEFGGDDGLGTSIGIAGQRGGRNAPSVLDTVFLRRLFWDGRADSLEQQALGPLTNPVEMGLPSLDDVVAIVAADEDYRAAFAEAFGRPVDIRGIAAAIAAFERTLVTANSPYDRFVAGDDAALDESQRRGMALFDEIGCRQCHRDPSFTVAADPAASPYRRFPVFEGSALVARHGLREDTGRNGAGVWRVPSLRNVERTAPYFHNGAVERLEDAVRIMIEAQLGRSIGHEATRIERNGTGRPRVSARRPLSDADVADIVAFLRALTGEPPAINAATTSLGAREGTGPADRS